MSAILGLIIFFAAFSGMEAVAWVTHRYVMHGVLWVWHESHHQTREGLLELNDLFAVCFAIPAIVCIYLGVNGETMLLPLGCGITAYGMVYFVFHDGLVHRRFRVPLDPAGPFWRPKVQAHRLHHAVRTRDGCVSFGFLWAFPVRRLKVALDQLRTLHRE
jgi:beta-carotene 3-hydroxylase